MTRSKAGHTEPPLEAAVNSLEDKDRVDPGNDVILIYVLEMGLMQVMGSVGHKCKKQESEVRRQLYQTGQETVMFRIRMVPTEAVKNSQTQDTFCGEHR